MKKIRFVTALLCLFLVNVMPVSADDAASPPKVVDHANLLRDTEEAELTEKINSMIEKFQIDVVLYTESRKHGADIQNEADLLFDNNGYGIGDTKDGVLFLLSMQEREWAISTHGKAIDMFSGYALNKMGQKAAEKYFSKGHYSNGFNSFLDTLDRTADNHMKSIEQAKDNNAGIAEQGTNEANEVDEANEANGANEANKANKADGSTDIEVSEEKDQPQDSSTTDKVEQNQEDQEEEDEEDEKTPVDYIIPALICGLIITLIIMRKMKKKLKAVESQDDADVYKSKDIGAKIYKNDEFLTSKITKTRLEKYEPKSSGGGTTHTSSNGEKHGGASGKF